MAFSPPVPSLYPRVRRAVILAGIGLLLAQILPAQSAGKGKANQGPRALGLLELAPNGKAHLIPITILYDGQFYDASAYKATPVPMALETGTVYEAIKSGVSQGLFTVKGALQMNTNWIGDGTWQPAGSTPPPKKEAAPAAPPPDQDLDAPPRLRRPGSEKPKAAEPTPPPASTEPPKPAVSAPPAEVPAQPPPEDPDRPTLRRGKPVPAPEKAPSKTASKPATDSSAKPASVAAPAMQMIPAISDAGGVEPRPYTYNLKPEEEQKLRAKILALAADEVRARTKQLTTATEPSAKGGSPRAKPSVKSQQPIFEDVQLHAFDLANSNEAVLVLEGKAQMPQAAKTKNTETQYYITLVAREDLYGELHKAFSNVTDAQHGGALPRMEFVDAVDADGDGRGELLFRQSSDAGTAFAVYRVIGNQLWPLFQGTPGQ